MDRAGKCGEKTEEERSKMYKKYYLFSFSFLDAENAFDLVKYSLY